jgi:predicted RNA binding protein YcfA (HicA-like mRNA interferase family)
MAFTERHWQWFAGSNLHIDLLQPPDDDVQELFAEAVMTGFGEAELEKQDPVGSMLIGKLPPRPWEELEAQNSSALSGWEAFGCQRVNASACGPQHGNHGGLRRGFAEDFQALRVRVLFKMLAGADWELDRITGSHHIFTKQGKRCIPVAVHGSRVSRSLTRQILKQAGVFQPRAWSNKEKEEANETPLLKGVIKKEDNALLSCVAGSHTANVDNNRLQAMEVQRKLEEEIELQEKQETEERQRHAAATEERGLLDEDHARQLELEKVQTFKLGLLKGTLLQHFQRSIWLFRRCLPYQ